MSENKVVKLIYKFVFGLMILSFVYFGYKAMIKIQKPISQTNKESCLKQKNKEYKGVIIENTWSRGSLISVFEDKSLFKWRCKSKVRDIIEVGDSIYKPSGTFDTYIYKNSNPDSVIFVECDFDCDYWETRYGKE